MLSILAPFICFGLLYYIPSLLFILIAKSQSKKKAIYQELNSKVDGPQSALIFFIYFILIGEIGYNFCTTYIETKKGLVDNDSVLFLLVLIIPICVQFFCSLVFLPKFWNPCIKFRGRQNLLIIFFLLNIFFTLKITGLILNTRSMSGLFFLLGALPAFPSFILIPYLAGKEIKPVSEFTQKSNGFIFEIRTKQLVCLLFLYAAILISQKVVIYTERTSLGIAPKQALNISNDDLLTDEKYILGEDKNNNSIRDDYEFWVEKNYVDYDEKMALMQYGKTQFLQMKATVEGMKKIKGKQTLSMVNLEKKDSDLTEYYVRKHLFWAGACVDYVFQGDELYKKRARDITKKANAILINNKDRDDVDHIAHFSGGGFNIPDYEGCNFIMKKEANKKEIASKNLRNLLIHSIEKGELEKVKIDCQQIKVNDLEDYMVAEVSTTALLKQDESILNALFDCGIDFRKKFRDDIYAFSEDPYDVAKGFNALNSLKWFDSKYK